MSMSSIIVMIVGISIIWGGLGASIWHAVKKGKQQ
ncbi:MAG TPA: MetS family NSS transporter small subunit [Bacillota bacterium]|nr:MetS family NSS transporter small subunit [Bacillota bacterium]